MHRAFSLLYGAAFVQFQSFPFPIAVSCFLQGPPYQCSARLSVHIRCSANAQLYIYIYIYIYICIFRPLHADFCFCLRQMSHLSLHCDCSSWRIFFLSLLFLFTCLMVSFHFSYRCWSCLSLSQHSGLYFDGPRVRLLLHCRPNGGRAIAPVGQPEKNTRQETEGKHCLIACRCYCTQTSTNVRVSPVAIGKM